MRLEAGRSSLTRRPLRASPGLRKLSARRKGLEQGSLFRAEDLDYALRVRIGSLESSPTLKQVFDAFDEVMRRPRAFDPKGFLFEVGRIGVHPPIRGEAFLAVVVNEPGEDRDGLSESEGLCAIGYDVSFDLPEGRESKSELFDGYGDPWKAFSSALVAREAWRAVADLRCVSVDVEETDA